MNAKIFTAFYNKVKSHCWESISIAEMNQALCYSDTNVKQFILDSADKSADKIDQELYNALQVAFM